MSHSGNCISILFDILTLPLPKLNLLWGYLDLGHFFFMFDCSSEVFHDEMLALSSGSLKI
jgi:hypothetical protein